MKNIFYTIILILFLGIIYNSNARNPIKKNTNKSEQTITSGCLPAATSAELDLNNVRALIHTGGDMWWDYGANVPRYEIPAGSGKHSLFAGGIWVGGVDVNGQLRLCARMYRSNGNDYWPGPLISSGEAIASVSSQVCTEYDKLYKIKKEQVEDFVGWFNADAATKAKLYADYSVPQIINDWPAHGPVDQGAYDYYLAPFQDVDADGIYNPSNGDYPYYVLDKATTKCDYQPERRAENLGNTSQKLFGDLTMWWVYNDKGNVHTQSTGAASIGMEFRAQAFAFSTSDALNNMSFYNYQIINRSTYSLNDAYFGVWTDADLGFADDDFVGCDVKRGLGYLYNGDAIDGDGSGKSYGAHPPAVGIDFFEGPYQDPDNNDNPSSWKEPEKTNLDCNGAYGKDTEGNWVARSESGILTNGNINGLNFGDGVIDNERWGMRRYLYFNRESSNTATTDPATAIEFYNYLKGIWKDGTRMTYGRTGYKDGALEADFMFPNDTDPCGWGTNLNTQDAWNEETARGGQENEAGDRRFVQSAGPFVLEPGAVNDITIGVVWARANSTPWASVEMVRTADIMAQSLFENCFQLIDGPTAPDLTIIQLDRKLIFHLSNKPTSNNYLESYYEKDPFIDPSVPEEDKYFKFQGYQVFQLKDNTVTLADIDDENKARVVFQCDVKDSVTNIINFVWDPDLQANIPVLKVEGANNGIAHSFEITYDAFSTGTSRALVNYKDYYYMTVAYAYNNYAPYYPVSSGSMGKQTAPYLTGRKNVLIYSATPNKLDAFNGGTKVNSEYGDVPSITMIEGKGNGQNAVELSDSAINEILSKTKAPYKADKRTYKKGYSPVQVKVIDPVNVINAQFTLRMIPDSVHPINGFYNPADSSNWVSATGLLLDTKWELSWKQDGETKSIISNSWIRYRDELIIPELGLSITLNQIEFPMQDNQRFDDLENENNGFITAEEEVQDINNQWLGFVPDRDGTNYLNWIRSGTQTPDDESGLFGDYNGKDNNQIFENVLSGTWAPYQLTSTETYGPGYAAASLNSISTQKYRIPSVDLVITKNKDLWTRCPVIEMAENNADGITNSLSEGGVLRFQLRYAPSKNKEGVSAIAGDPNDDENSDAPNYIGATGMSWFPGYAIDQETGERLNIMFGEDSWLVGENGNDMLWNPSATLVDWSATWAMGGKHYIYIVGHNEVVNNKMPAYDEGRTIYNMLKPGQTTTALKNNMQNVWKHPAWVAIPILTSNNYQYTSYDDMPDNTITIKLRMANPYFVGIGDVAVANPVNQNYPTFTFSTSEISASKQNIEASKSALDLINIVPNPYYGHSEYELTQLENYVKITNLPERCIITIYTPNGNIVRQFSKDNSDAFLEWDLKNSYNISIASGMYIIHINVPGVGEKVIKWFGSMRPVDLNSF
jgi:hypothetical protein